MLLPSMILLNYFLAGSQIVMADSAALPSQCCLEIKSGAGDFFCSLTVDSPLDVVYCEPPNNKNCYVEADKQLGRPCQAQFTTGLMDACGTTDPVVIHRHDGPCKKNEGEEVICLYGC